MKGKMKKFAIGAMLAAAGGYVAGILTAPKSGKETRKDIQKTAVKVKTEAEKNLKKLHSDLTALIEKAKKNTSSLQGEVKSNTEKAVVLAQNAKEKVREVLSSLHEGVAKDKELNSALKEANEAVKHLKKYIEQYDKKATK